jgi:hypothetical protein
LALPYFLCQVGIFAEGDQHVPPGDRRLTQATTAHSGQASSVFTSLTLEIDMLPKAVAETASNGHAQATAGSLVKFYCVRQLACKIARHLGLVLQRAPRAIVSSLDERTFEFTRGLFPLIGRSRISFTGSYVSARMIRWFASRLTRHNLARLESNIAFAATLAICAPLARFASRIEERQNPRRFPAHCTSMTIEIDLP